MSGRQVFKMMAIVGWDGDAACIRLSKLGGV